MLAGLFSLAMVLVVATNLRLLIENFLKYGFLLGKGALVTGALRSVAPTNNPKLLACWPGLLLLCVLILGWEKFGAWRVAKDVKVRRKPPLWVVVHCFRPCVCNPWQLHSH